MIAEQRAFDIQQIDYKDRFSVISSIYQGNPQMLQTEEGKLKAEINAVRYAIEPLNRVSDKLRFLCEAWMSNECREVIENEMPKDIQSYLSLGKDRLKANGYRISRIKRELGVREEDIVKQLEERIHSTFKTGDRIPKSTIKERLEQIYDDVGCDRTAKAVDLKDWFNIKEITIGKAKTRTKGIEIL